MTAADVHTPTGGSPSAPVPAAGTADVDLTVAGTVTIRLLGVRPADRRAVERQYGESHPVGTGPADITIRYCERLDLDDQVLRYLGPGSAGFTDEGFVILRGRFRSPVRVLFPGAEVCGPCELRCEHGVGRVPHLVALVNLAVLARGGVALHASAFARDGSATVATGWSKGGKTEALLTACSRGATYVADEWTHIGSDRTASGTWEPVRVWDWQLAQLPWLRAGLDRGERARLAALRSAERAAEVGRVGARASTAIGRNRFVDLPPEAVARQGRADGPVPIGRLLLMTSTDRPLTWTHPVSGREVADRMAASLVYERQPLAEIVSAFRFAFPAAATRTFDEVAEREHERLRSLLDPIPAVEVLHPYPVDLGQLGATIAAAERELG